MWWFLIILAAAVVALAVVLARRGSSGGAIGHNTPGIQAHVVRRNDSGVGGASG